MLYYSGRVNRVIFENPADAFYILVVRLDEQFQEDSLVTSSTICVRGNILGMKVAVGTWFGFEGKWVNDPRYGRQVKIVKSPVVRGGWTTEVAVAMLPNHGVPTRVAERLAEHFGDSLVSLLDTGNPELLEDVPGITPFAAAHVSERWTAIRSYFAALDFLGDAGLPPSKVRMVWSHFGDETEKVLTSNPWSLVQVDGVTFQQADEVALRMGKSPDDPKRVAGAVLHAVKEARVSGHLYLNTTNLLGEVRSIIPGVVTPQRLAAGIRFLYEGDLLVVDQSTRPGLVAIYDPWTHHLESECARLLKLRWESAQIVGERAEGVVRLMGWAGPAAEKSAEAGGSVREVARAALTDWSAGSRMQLSDHQLLGALNSLVEPVSILTGLPGTGKSTTLRAVVKVLQDADIQFLLLAPTGIAAKRMNTLTGAPAYTIHRAFEAKGWDKGEERDATYVGVVGSGAQEGGNGSDETWGSAGEADVVIIDESSMMDQHLLYRVLTCTRSDARIVFVGDAAQLPSVGPGNVLRDLIATEIFPTVNLTQIFRQADTSDIVVAAHDIYNGVVPTPSLKGDFTLLETPDEDKVQDLILKLATGLYERRRNFQVLSPRLGGVIGVTKLNEKLRGLLNPKSPGVQEMRMGSDIVREDDRVMVVKNNYELGVFNGDVGKIARIDRKGRNVEVKIHGPPVSHVNFPFRDAPRFLRLAYCQTIHKMQGQEADVIVMPLVPGFGWQLQRNLIYTAITRARKKVFLVGTRTALSRAVENNRLDARNTLFPERLQALFCASGLAQKASSGG